jgi:hypothetical protein
MIQEEEEAVDFSKDTVLFVRGSAEKETTYEPQHLSAAEEFPNGYIQNKTNNLL